MGRRELIDMLSAARQAAGLTQAQLAAECEVSSQQVSRWERGTAVPGARVLSRLAGVLGIPEGDLYRAAIAASQQETKQVRREANEVIAKVERFVETYEAFHAAYDLIGRQVERLVGEMTAMKADIIEIKQAVHQPPQPRRPSRP